MGRKELDIAERLKFFTAVIICLNILECSYVEYIYISITVVSFS